MWRLDYSNHAPLDTLTLDIYPSGFSSSVLYEDDGHQGWWYDSDRGIVIAKVEIVPEAHLLYDS